MKKLFLLLALTATTLCTYAQGDVYKRSKTYEWPSDTKVIDNLHHWQDLKFGVLMHWGVYSVPGIVESWSIVDEDWITRDTTQTFQQYQDWYFGLADKFNPTKFDPAQWADVMSQAGMKYMIFTTKHHDGFCMFDSRYTDYTIAQHAFKDNPKRDVLRHVLDAFREKGFMTGTYFSKPDWHSQYYWWDVYPKKGRNVNYPIKKHAWRWEQFKQYTYNQMEEILSRYGKVDILWMDGGWVCKQNGQDIDMPHIAQMARRQQPGLIMVDRTIHGEYENYQTPERTIPETQLNYPWESCIPLSDDWGWVPRPRWKTPEKVINTLIEIVAKGGNLVLGVGPTPEGLIQPEATERLKKIGQWLNENGKAIYNTVPTEQYQDGNVWFTKSKDNSKTYVVYMLDENAKLPAEISWSGHKPKRGTKATLLCNGKKLSTRQKGNKTVVKLPKGLKQQSFAMEIEE
ncbi:MAG: alpha-L-fucosidase [Prevotella sp.]|nr:alpha-L-fucosidase [Prevotella sp.]